MTGLERGVILGSIPCRGGTRTRNDTANRPYSRHRFPMQPPKEYTVQQVAELLRSDRPPRLVDVREQAEWNLVHLEGSLLLTEALVGEILSSWPPEAHIVCYCHHGVRSVQAAMFLAAKGFTNVYSMRGGIDAWAIEIDPSLPRY